MQPNDVSSNWIFAYGSLIWRPGFDFVKKNKAKLSGAHRSLCIYSFHYRGTKENPGLVFGLQKGGSCNGMAFKITNENWEETINYLREREQVNNVYYETTRLITLENGEKVRALTYLANPKHKQFCGKLDLEKQVNIIKNATGEAGDNIDYILNTANHLIELNIKDTQLSFLSKKLQIG